MSKYLGVLFLVLGAAAGVVVGRFALGGPANSPGDVASAGRETGREGAPPAPERPVSAEQPVPAAAPEASAQHKGFKTVPVERGSLEATISATGTLEPEEVVDVGAQVQGSITGFGKDRHGKSIDYGSEVEPGMLLAQIDPRAYKAQLDQADANLKRAEADLIQMKTRLAAAERDWRRAQQRGRGVASAGADYDTALATYETAKGNVGVGVAAIKQAESSKELADINLKYCQITSPVRGVIIDRRVSIGQTVISRLNAPSLFLLAKDLTNMQIRASVNETDIAQIKAAQQVTYTVDAFRGDYFVGKVNMIRLNARMTQNVVAYTVVVDTDNSDLKLLPYMTAKLHFHVKQRKNILKVANSALRWLPDVKQVAPESREELFQIQRRRGTGGTGGGEPGVVLPPAGAGRGPYAGSHPPPRGRGGPQGRGGAVGQVGQPPAARVRQERGVIWVEDNGYVKPIQVKVGLTDGSTSEISGEGIGETTRAVIGEDDAAANPFTPQSFNRNRQQRGGALVGQRLADRALPANGLVEPDPEKYGSAAGAVQFAKSSLPKIRSEWRFLPAHDFAAVMDRETHQWTVTGDVGVARLNGWPLIEQEHKWVLLYNSSSRTYDVVSSSGWDLFGRFDPRLGRAERQPSDLGWRAARLDDMGKWRQHGFKQPVASAAPLSTFIFVVADDLDRPCSFTADNLEAKRTSSRGVAVYVDDVRGGPLSTRWGVRVRKNLTKKWTLEFGGPRRGGGLWPRKWLGIDPGAPADRFLNVGCYGAANNSPDLPFCTVRPARTTPLLPELLEHGVPGGVRLPFNFINVEPADFVVWEIETSGQRVARLAIDFFAGQQGFRRAGSLRINSFFQPVEPELNR
jgi:HlyD family secretion protein